jgi:F-type H+-transporting ATPase subunit a
MKVNLDVTPKFLTIRLLLIFLPVLFAPDAAGAEDDGGGNKTGFIMHHIQDSHQWHFATVGHTHITLPLPVIIYELGHGLRAYMSSAFYDEHHNPVNVDGYMIDSHDKIHYIGSAAPQAVQYGHQDADHPVFYDISITKNVASMIVSVLILFGVFLTVARRYRTHPGESPKGVQSVFEPIIIFIRDEIAKPNIGEKYEKFMPYLLSVFFFIWFNNLLGLLPGAANLTGNIAVTLTLAVFTFIITTVSASKDYWIHIFNTPGVPWWLKFPVPLMPIVEFIGVFTKPFSLMVRLFANITAGHIIILSLIALVFIFETWAIGIVSVLFGLFMNMVELLVAFIQAFVFTLLSAIYFGLAVEQHVHEESEEVEEEALIV